MSVLQSLRSNLEEFSLRTVREEVSRWMTEGIHWFAQQWQAILAREAAPLPNTS